MAAPSKIKSGTIKAILKHAEDGYPNEVCGVVVSHQRVWRNTFVV